MTATPPPKTAAPKTETIIELVPTVNVAALLAVLVIGVGVGVGVYWLLTHVMIEDARDA